MIDIATMISINNVYYTCKMLELFFFCQTKNTSIGIDQTRSHDGSSSSMAEKKTLNVRMKSLFQGNRELSVYDSKELIYYIDHSQVHTHNKEVWLLNDNGEIVFKIRPKVKTQ